MHNCPSCKKSTSNLLVLDDGIKEDICDDCALITIVLAYPESGSLEESLMIQFVSDCAAAEALLL